MWLTAMFGLLGRAQVHGCGERLSKPDRSHGNDRRGASGCLVHEWSGPRFTVASVGLAFEQAGPGSPRPSYKPTVTVDDMQALTGSR